MFKVSSCHILTKTVHDVRNYRYFSLAKDYACVFHQDSLFLSDSWK